MRSVGPLSEAAERFLKPKDVFRECDQFCPEMVVVPAGSFMMGSPASEEDRFDTEGPQHRVTIARSFAVGRFAVTFDEWDACVADGGCDYRPEDEGWGRGRRPVINVSWDDAKLYLSWLSKKTGKAYRLLSEAEWEYVTRAGTTTPFWWGSSISPNQANYGEYREHTVPVDSFEASPFGLYQVHGNVWEWVEDRWNRSYSGAPTDGSAWTGGECDLRVLRGGSWNFGPGYLRAAIRVGDVAGNRIYYFGFRVARTLTL